MIISLISSLTLPSSGSTKLWLAMGANISLPVCLSISLEHTMLYVINNKMR